MRVGKETYMKHLCCHLASQPPSATQHPPQPPPSPRCAAAPMPLPPLRGPPSWRGHPGDPRGRTFAGCRCREAPARRGRKVLKGPGRPEKVGRWSPNSQLSWGNWGSTHTLGWYPSFRETRTEFKGRLWRCYETSSHRAWNMLLLYQSPCYVTLATLATLHLLCGWTCFFEWPCAYSIPSRAEKQTSFLFTSCHYESSTLPARTLCSALSQ